MIKEMGLPRGTKGEKRPRIKEKKDKSGVIAKIIKAITPRTEYDYAYAYCEAWKWHIFWCNAYLSYLIQRSKITAEEAEDIAQKVGIIRSKDSYDVVYRKASDAVKN